MRIVDAAAVPSKPARPQSPLINLALAILLGAFALASERRFPAGDGELTDKSVRSRGDALAAGGLPVLGALPRMRHLSGKSAHMLGSGTAWEKASDKFVALQAEIGGPQGRSRRCSSRSRETQTAYAESFNQLYASIALADKERVVKVIVFTSPLPGEGKTLSAINFALVGASRGLRVLLIDADLRCGVVSTALGIPREPGFRGSAGGDRDRWRDRPPDPADGAWITVWRNADGCRITKSAGTRAHARQ